MHLLCDFQQLPNGMLYPDAPGIGVPCAAKYPYLFLPTELL